MNKEPEFIDNSAALARPEAFVSADVDVARVLESWRLSLYSFEWLLPDGSLKFAADLPEGEQAKRRAVEEALERGEALEKPVLGLGLQETIEIGSGRAVFLTLAAKGAQVLPAHILKSQMDDFKAFIAQV
ncbi:MAG: hypothetical protein KDI46_00245 [Alphaproteobacteria bacterium]|nr:hypothetical protein [Alphaproteobacteria bacterium]